ncbi:isopentenyl transferase family protein [Streptomyces lunaelactis]|uniref:isopentenyl transferase family protein n=1 Tax=Streptomyces lunaelactis TaxID=1535768 RepID=UPI00211D8899|nr:isopentenyl transferase family protein [Streptomyces lunaelactis]
MVVEGGSISLLDVLLARPEWSNGWRVHVTVCVERSASRYDADVAARVERMLGYGTRPGEARTLQHELVALWDHPQARKHTAEVLGYQQAIDLCEIHGLPPQQLTGPAGPLWRGELAQLIHGAHLAYARQQRRALAAALPALNDIAERVELCET